MGTEHLLLGLIREEEGVAAQVLIYLGLKLEYVREEVLNLLGHPTDTLEREKHTLEREHALGILLNLPAEVLKQVAELAQQIAQLTREKEEAVAECDYEKAAGLRDRADKLKKQMQSIFRQAQ